MRITLLQTERTFLSNIATLNERLDTANQQISSGKKILSLKDSPAASAELVGLRKELADIDQYRANADAGSLYVGVSDSALSSVYTSLTAIFTKGSQATSEVIDATGRAGLATEIRALRDHILALANTEIQGRYVFAGSRSNAPAFTIEGDTVTYQGDQVVNQIAIGDGVTVQQGFAGDEVFSPVFDTINQLLAAVDAGDTAAMQTALTQFSATLSGVNRFRVQLGVAQNNLTDIGNDQDSRKVSVTSRQSTLEDADLAKSITDLQRIQTALQAALAARSSVQGTSLFDYLG